MHKISHSLSMYVTSTRLCSTSLFGACALCRVWMEMLLSCLKPRKLTESSGCGFWDFRNTSVNSRTFNLPKRTLLELARSKYLQLSFCVTRLSLIILIELTSDTVTCFKILLSKMSNKKIYKDVLTNKRMSVRAWMWRIFALMKYLAHLRE